MVRLFVAIWPPDDVVKSIVAAMTSVDLPGGRAVPAENLHVTLAFLGEVDDGEVDSISTALATIESSPLDLAIEPTPVWFHGGQLVLPVDGADALAAKIDDALGHTRDRPYRGHLTVARTRSATRPRIGGFDVPRQFEATSFALVESQLNPGGPQYTTLRQFDLG